jgi:hypothetical protein
MNMDSADFGAGAFIGALFVSVLAVLFWHMGESGCQKAHDVYDCEWSQSPFTPKLIETTSEGPTP